MLTWNDYLASNSVTIVDNKVLSENIDRLRKSNNMQTLAIVGGAVLTTAAVDQANRAIQDGFDKMGMNLNDLRMGIERLGAQFSYDMGLVLNTLQIQDKHLQETVAILKGIEETLKHPRRTKARELYEDGLMALQRKVLRVALKDFLEAERLYETDVLLQLSLGKLYLFGRDENENVIDLEKALEHFEKSIEFAEGEINVDPENRQIPNPNYFLSEACFYAGITCYAISNDKRLVGDEPDESEKMLDKAIMYIRKAVDSYEFPESQ